MDMIYDVQLSVINPKTYKATKHTCTLTLDYTPDYEDIVIEFFRQWNMPDKYDTCYAIGVESMKLYGNKN